MNNPLDVMYAEHDVIMKAEDIIKKLDNTWKDDALKYSSSVRKLISFLREYADGYHHHKEEDVLFPAVYDHPDFVLQDLIDELNIHHEAFRGYISDILDALDEADYAGSFKLLTQYINELLDHIAVENDEFFVLAGSLLSQNQLETIFFNFKDVDMQLGEERKRELELMISNW